MVTAKVILSPADGLSGDQDVSASGFKENVEQPAVPELARKEYKNRYDYS